jgi:hypothetical protein
MNNGREPRLISASPQHRTDAAAVNAIASGSQVSTIKATSHDRPFAVGVDARPLIPFLLQAALDHHGDRGGPGTLIGPRPFLEFL